MDLNDLQKEQAAWGKRNFPNAKPYQALLGAVEEIGELSHAHLKAEQGIRTVEDHHAGKVDAVADIIIYLCHYCTMSGIEIGPAVSDTWSAVKRRDWTKNKEDGSQPCNVCENWRMKDDKK